MSSRARVTIYGIAKEAGVSVSTVSRVLTGSARVAQDKRRRVEDVIKRHHYRPSHLARGLSKGRSGVIGFILPDVSHPYYGTAFMGAENRAVELGYSVILGNTLNDNIGHVTNVESRLLEVMVDRHVDGLIVAGGRVQEAHPVAEHVQEMRRVAERVPVVTVSGRMRRVDCYSVTVDEAKGIELAVNYLVTLGHRRLGFLGGMSEIEPTGTRLACFRACLATHGLENVPEWCRLGGFGIEDGRAGMEEYLQMRDRPTAIVSLNDLNAIGAIYAARKSGLRIPAEMSIVGIDNINLTEYVVPRITSVDLRPREQGALAVEIMAEILQGQRPRRHSVLEPRLVIRDSCTGVEPTGS